MIISEAPMKPAYLAIWSFGTDFAPLCVFMGYFGVLVFWCIAWLTVLYGLKVGNLLEIGPFSVADWGFEPWYPRQLNGRMADLTS
jgi:hypothetical protein